MSITDFLLARIAEDEAAARAAIDESGWYSSTDGRWSFVEVPYEGEWPRNPDAENVMWSYSPWTLHAERHDPARVLAECAAKRAIVAECATVQANPWDYADAIYTAEASVYALAAVYAFHPDYQDEWKVGA